MFEKEQVLAYREFTKRKQAYEKSEKETYSKTFERSEWTETFHRQEWMEKDVEEQLEQNSQYQKYLKALCTQEIKLIQLSMSRDRENITQILLKKVYVPQVHWNKDIYLFAFENCIFDIKTKQRVTPQKEQYINQSCGYEYDFTYPVSRIEDLKVLIQSILPTESVRHFYFWLSNRLCLPKTTPNTSLFKRERVVMEKTFSQI